MSKKNADTQSEADEGSSINNRAMQPRTGRIKQTRRLREKSTVTLRGLASAASLMENAKAPKQARLRQLKATKQYGARLMLPGGGAVDQPKVGFARPMQLRQISARKSIQPSSLLVAQVPIEDKTSLSRTGQLRQSGLKKRASVAVPSK